MRRLFALFFTIGLICFTIAAQAAMVTGARWGQQEGEGLRFVVDVSEATSHQVKLGNKTLTLTVEGVPSAQVLRSYPINRKLAESMTVSQNGNQTVLTINLKEDLATDAYKSFVLKTPSRIVLDVLNKVAVPSKPANAGETWTNTQSTTSSGSWTDRFHKDQPPKQTLTPSQRVKQMLEENRNRQKNQGAQTTQTTNPTTNTTQTTTPVVKPVTPTNPTPANVGTAAPATTSGASTQQKVAEQQGNLKKYLTAKQAARREAKANADSKNKVVKNKEGVTTKVEDGITYIKGNGKFEVTGGLKNKVIVIDPGHGGSDPGAIGDSRVYEKNITMAIATLLKDNLNKAGAKVYLTRTKDVDVAGAGASDKAELQARINVAEKICADAFVSIHINSAVNKNIGGLSCYYYPKTKHDGRLAKAIQSRLVSNFNLQNLGVREANFYVNKRCTMPSTLLELGFISNPTEEALMKTKSFQEKAAKVICDGLKDYFN